MSKRTLLAWCAMLFGSTLVAAAGAQAARDAAAAVRCGDAITVDTTLTANLTCSGSALQVVGPAVLDLGGHTLKGKGTGTGVTLTGPQGAVVTGGTVTGFQDGVDVNTWQARVHDLTVSKNSLAGIQFVSHRPGAVVERNTITRNGYGIKFNNDNQDVQVLDNTVTYNTQMGIVASYGVDASLFQGNRVNRNVMGGMAIYDSTTSILGNEFNSNGGDGLLASESFAFQYWLIGGNHANNNGGHGINVLTPGIPDGGGNRARGNVLNPQCVNITC